MTPTNLVAPAGATRAACDNPDIRVLRRVLPLDAIPLAPRGDEPIRRICVLDTETTGTDPLVDEIIDLAIVMLEVDATGEIVGIASQGEALRDPGMPIPPVITRLTRIGDADVAGKTIDLDRLERRLHSADVLIAHNAKFDIAFIEALVPGIAGAAWACSANDVDWTEAGFDGAKLGHLLMQAGWFNTAHRAMADVVSLIHLLAHRLPGGHTVLSMLLDRAAQPTIRIEATGAPFDRRGVLKARGYRWDAHARVWWTEIAEDDLDEETAWLRREVTPWGPSPRTQRVTWHQRHR
jgi:DNA polymerase-3 subunit epsilon